MSNIKVISDTTFEREFSAGEYFIGDLCYFFQHNNKADDIYQKLFNAPINDNWDFIGEICSENKCYPYAMIGTKFGDGSFGVFNTEDYNSKEIKVLPVDAGNIGIIPVSMFEDNSFKDILRDISEFEKGGKNEWLALKVNIKEPFKVKTEEKKIEFKNDPDDDDCNETYDYDAKIIIYSDYRIVT